MCTAANRIIWLCLRVNFWNGCEHFNETGKAAGVVCWNIATSESLGIRWCLLIPTDSRRLQFRCFRGLMRVCPPLPSSSSSWLAKGWAQTHADKRKKNWANTVCGYWSIHRFGSLFSRDSYSQRLERSWTLSLQRLSASHWQLVHGDFPCGGRSVWKDAFCTRRDPVGGREALLFNNYFQRRHEKNAFGRPNVWWSDKRPAINPWDVPGTKPDTWVEVHKNRFMRDASAGTF